MRHNSVSIDSTASTATNAGHRGSASTATNGQFTQSPSTTASTATNAGHRGQFKLSSASTATKRQTPSTYAACSLCSS